MKQTTCYISGKISGLDEIKCKANFSNTYWDIYTLVGVYSTKDIINPLEIKPLFGIRSWFFHMVADILALLFCTHVAFQKNWIDSKGAKIEMIVALMFKKKIIML